MKRLSLTIALVLLCLSVFAKGAKISDIRVEVTLDSIGNGQITETLDVEVIKGTEFYLVRNNLGNIEIGNLAVSDETGRIYRVEENWISEGRSIEEKAGKCGIATTDKGKEICWGLGSYGHHIYTVSYSMTNMVKGLQDADVLHFQFVSPKMSSSPEHATVTVKFTGECTGIKGFGYVGKCEIKGNSIVAETTEKMESDNSVIVLAKFPKGTFEISETLYKTYADVEEMAEDDDSAAIIGAFSATFLIVVLVVWLIVALDRSNRRAVAGVSKLSEIEPSRTVPFGGDILRCWYILHKAWQEADYTSALLLKLVKEGYVKIQYDKDGKTEIAIIKEADQESLYAVDRQFLRFIEKASGDDRILQKKEFERWAARHIGKLDKWSEKVEKEAEAFLKEDGTLDSRCKFTEDGKERARRVLAYYRYLKDYSYGESEIGNEMIFGALCGFSGKLLKIYRNDPSTIYLYHLFLFNNRISTAAIPHGGGTSVSGGGGFSGGGAGGGCR